MTLLEPDALDRMAFAYGDALELTMDGLDTALSGLWAEYGGITDADLRRWMTAAEPVIVGAQEVAAQNAAAWLDVNMTAIGAEALPPTAATALESPSLLLTEPPVRARYLLSQGYSYEAAMDTTSAYVRRLGSTILRAAEQEGRAQRASAVRTYVPEGYRAISGGRLRRDTRVSLLYVRVPNTTACAWCRLVADRPYGEEGVKGSWHAHCKCSWRLGTPQDFAGQGQFADGAWRDVSGADRAQRQSYKTNGVEHAEERAAYWRQRATDSKTDAEETRYTKRSEAWAKKAETRRART